MELQTPAAAATKTARAYPESTFETNGQTSIAPSVQSIQTFRTTDGATIIEGQEVGPSYVTSRIGTVSIIASTTLMSGLGSMLNGLVTVALPALTEELKLPKGLELWPSSIQSLTLGCTLLISGSLVDALGSRLMYLTGCVLQAGFVLGCGLCQNGTQLILFRGLSGISLSFCLPSAVSIITSAFAGRRRNMAFATMGGAQPAGFAIGLVVGGVLTDNIGWRVGFYVAAAVNAIIFTLGLWSLPKSLPVDRLTWGQKWAQITHEIDWVGAVIASASLAMLSYVFAALTGATSTIREPSSIVLLCIAFALIPVFIFWVGRQERLEQPAIIPNSLWRNRAFTTICISVFMIWGSFNAAETMLTFFFQEAQGLSATQTSVRFLPSPIMGVAANVLMGFLVTRVRADALVITGVLISCGSPLAAALSKPESGYWRSGFVATMLNPIGADSMFTVSNLLITSVFPAKTQGLAGGVFNTVSQIGKSVGLALVAVIASSVTADSGYADKDTPDALMVGYSAAFYLCFAMCAVTLFVQFWGLKRIGKVGHKRD